MQTFAKLTCSRYLLESIALLTVVCLYSSLNAGAQVVLDGKFGTSGAIAGPNFNIPADIGATRGNNLFHSFSQFDLVKGDVATFSGPANIQNILARVTGGAASSIDGTVRSDISGANLYLMNPKGIIFGPNASVDVRGSFAATTADYLKLADGARFIASLNADDSVLSTAPVAAFGFLGNQPGTLSVQQSTLGVAHGKSISLVGGDIKVDGGTLHAGAGQINVASVRSPGEVPLEPTPVHVDSFSQFGRIDLQNSAHLDASGNQGGRVVIRGGRLTIDNSKIEANTTGSGDGKGIDVALAGDLTLSNGGEINSLSPGGVGASGNIQVTSKSIHMDGGGAVDDSFNPTTGISAATGDVFAGGGPGKGGDVIIHTGTLDMVNSAQISSVTSGAGNAGRIEIDADSIRLDAQLLTLVQITANTQQTSGGAGKAGDIVIHAGSFELANGATVLAAAFGWGSAGKVDITANTMNLLNGGVITAGTFGSGPGGNIQVTADHLKIDGHDSASGRNNLTGVQAITTSSDAPAPGGNIAIKAGALEILNAGSVFTTSSGPGTGGNIDVVANTLTLNNAGTIQANGQAAGAAGNISVNASGPVLLNHQSGINTAAPASSGGNITVAAGSDVNVLDSTITAQAGLNGGNIKLTSPSLMYVLRSTITGEADTTGSGFGNGGNLSLAPSLAVLNHSSLVSKSSFGNGGNISILSDYFFASDTIIDASAPFGIPGTVQVTAPQVDLSGVLAVLPANLLDASTLLRPDCGVRLGGGISSFIVMGRGGVPLAPGGFVPSGAPRDKDDHK